MALHQPDPRFTHSPQARRSFALAARWSLVFVALLWALWIFGEVTGLNLQQYGLRPGSAAGLVGVVTAPLLHGGPGHLFNNSIPLLVTLTATLYLYPNSAVRVIPLIWVGSGLLGWLIGRPSVHIGASGLLYGLLAFVFLGGVLRRDLRSISVSLLVAFLYGTLIWGVLPVRPNMSWELHLAGAACGIVLALAYRRWDRVPLRRYEWEEVDEVPEWYPESTGEGIDLPAGRDAGAPAARPPRIGRDES